MDQAYVKYAPWPWLTAAAGKMANPFQTTDIAWDADVTPEGAALIWKSGSVIPVLSQWVPAKPFATIGAFTLTENATAKDPTVFSAQGGADVILPVGGWKWQPSVAYYGFTAIQGKATSGVAGAPAGNSTVGANFRYDYNVLDVLNKITGPEIFSQPIALIGDYVHNNGAEDNNSAWEAGMEVGKVTEKFGSWKAYYFYERKENDSTFGALTDSDFGGGGTNHKGHIFGAQIGLNKYMSAGLKYFHTEEINGTQNQIDTLYTDLQTQW